MCYFQKKKKRYRCVFSLQKHKLCCLFIQLHNFFQTVSVSNTAPEDTNSTTTSTTTTTTTASPLFATISTNTSSEQIDGDAMDAFISTIIESPPIHYISYSGADNVVGYKPPFDNQPFEVQPSTSDVSSKCNFSYQ